MWRVALLVVGFALLSSCKGHREFREARKQLKVEKADRKANPPQEESANAEVPSLAEAKAHQMPDSLFFGMSRTPCFGTCPHYDLRLYSSGYATYEGIDHVERIGQFVAQYAPALADSVAAYSQRIGFMFMLDNYDNSLVTDLPAVVFYLKVNDTPKRIYCRISCPQELMDFSTQIESWIEELEWTKMN